MTQLPMWFETFPSKSARGFIEVRMEGIIDWVSPFLDTCLDRKIWWFQNLIAFYKQ